jgi:hypothetical protein
VARFRNKEYYY